MARVSIDGLNPRVKTSRKPMLLALQLREKRKDSGVSHGLFFLDGSHSRINVVIFEFLDFLLMNFEVDGLSVFWVVGVANSFICGRDLSVVCLEHGVFKEETKCGHPGDHHPSGAVHLPSKAGASVTLEVTESFSVTWSITVGGVSVRTESTRAVIILR